VFTKFNGRLNTNKYINWSITYFISFKMKDLKIRNNDSNKAVFTTQLSKITINLI
jgi:hypothetical protein